MRIFEMCDSDFGGRVYIVAPTLLEAIDIFIEKKEYEPEMVQEIGANKEVIVKGMDND